MTSIPVLSSLTFLLKKFVSFLFLIFSRWLVIFKFCSISVLPIFLIIIFFGWLCSVSSDEDSIKSSFSQLKSKKTMLNRSITSLFVCFHRIKFLKLSKNISRLSKYFYIKLIKSRSSIYFNKSGLNAYDSGLSILCFRLSKTISR